MTKEAIHIDHFKPMIATTNDSQFFVKESGEWKTITSNLYKSEFNETPSNDLGVAGDYYAYYFRRYNFIPYSESFVDDRGNLILWKSFKTNIKQEPLMFFPENANPYKLRATTDMSKHYIYYTFSCKKNAPYTFSVYVRKSNYDQLKITLANADDSTGICNTVNLTNGTATLSTYGESLRISQSNATCEVYDELEKVYRISVSGAILDALNLRVSVKMLNENGEEEFRPVDEEKGFFLNGFQISKNAQLENYLVSTDKAATALTFIKLWKKLPADNSHPISSYPNGYWVSTNNNLHQLSEKPSLDLGINGDIATIDAILTLKPFVIFGNANYKITMNDKTEESNSDILINKNIYPRPQSKTITLIKGIKDRGTLFYSKKNDAWYIRTKKGNCRLMLKNPKPDYLDIAIAMSLGQQTYMTYNRGAKFVFRHGRNLGGNINFIRTKNWI